MEHHIETSPTLAPRDERVAVLAYEIWEQEGRPDGKSDEHWHLACCIIDAEDAGIEPKELPPWLSRAEVVVLETEAKPNEKSATIIKHKSAA